MVIVDWSDYCELKTVEHPSNLDDNVGFVVEGDTRQKVAGNCLRDKGALLMWFLLRSSSSEKLSLVRSCLKTYCTVSISLSDQYCSTDL